ncbi:MAG TPA: hypothetical protein VF403_18555 [Kofleriaceae bacterium]
MKSVAFVAVVLSAHVPSHSAGADSKAWTSGKSVISGSENIVGGISASSVRASALYQQWLPMLLSQAGDAKTALEAITKECSIDMLASLDSIAFGIDNNQTGSIVIALKGTNHKALDACAQKLGKADNKTVTITTEGKFTKYEGMGDKPVYLQWLAADVFAVSTSPDDKDASTKLLSSGVTSNKAMSKALGAINKGASAWLIVDKEQAIEGVGKVEQIYGNAVVANKKITLTGHIVTDTPATATSLSATATKKLADAQAGASKSLQAAIGSVSLKAAGADISASAAIAEDDVVALMMSVLQARALADVVRD